MASTVRVKRHLDSETVHLPEVRELLGCDVEITVSAVASPTNANERYPLRGSVLRYDEPFEPAAPNEWDAVK